MKPILLTLTLLAILPAGWCQQKIVKKPVILPRYIAPGQKVTLNHQIIENLRHVAIFNEGTLTLNHCLLS